MPLQYVLPDNEDRWNADQHLAADAYYSFYCRQQ